MPQFAGDRYLRAQERRRQLGDELFAGVCVVAETAGEVAIEPILVPRPVPVLVQLGGQVARVAFEAFTMRQQNAVEGRRVGGDVSAVANIGPECGDETLTLRQSLVQGKRRRKARETLRQPVHLLDVEDRVKAQEVSFLFFTRFGFLDCLSREHDRGRTLAFLDLPAERLGLQKCQPCRAAVAARERRVPEQQHIDPVVAPAAGGVVGKIGNAACLPGPGPRRQR